MRDIATPRRSLVRSAVVLVALFLVACPAHAGVRTAQQKPGPTLAAGVVRQLLNQAGQLIAGIEPPSGRVRPLIELARLRAEVDDLAGAEASMRLAASFGALPADQLTSFAWTAIARAEVRAGRPTAALDNLVRRWSAMPGSSLEAVRDLATWQSPGRPPATPPRCSRRLPRPGPAIGARCCSGRPGGCSRKPGIRGRCRESGP